MQCLLGTGTYLKDINKNLKKTLQTEHPKPISHLSSPLLEILSSSVCRASIYGLFKGSINWFPEHEVVKIGEMT